LQAAHAEGVVHRDLKPQNIMMDQHSRVVVMDFGIAHSQETPSMTMTGALVGTPEYMSPEQAKGEKTDARADIFAVGIILYEMLTGRIPFKAATVIETMYKRTQERAIPPVDLDSSVPVQANRIVMKCLEKDPANRYQTIEELLKDLEAVDPEKKIGALNRVGRSVVRRSIPWKPVAVVALLALIIAATLFVRTRVPAKTATASHAPVTVIVADFSNHTGEPVFDGALEPVVKMALEGAGFITVYDRTQMKSLGLPPVSGRLDEPAAGKIAVSQGLGVVVSGSLDRQGDGYALSIKATQAVTGGTIQIAEDSASKKDQVLFAATKLAATVRKALGDDTSDSALRFAADTLTAISLEAVHEYATGVDQLTDGKYEEALKSFSKAVDLDQNFGLAYAAMAIAARNLGRQQDAEQYIKLALEHIDRMTERERYRVRGSYFALHGDELKCVEAYGILINRFPSDATAHNNLAFCYTQLRNMPKAIDEVRQATVILPKRTLYRNNLALYLSYASDFQMGGQEARTVQQMQPDFNLGFISLAFAQLGQSQLTEAAETYKKLEKISKQGASDAASGLADLALYEGRFADAVRILQQGAAADTANKYADAAATKLAILAYIQLLQNQKVLAVSTAERALMSSKIVKIEFLAGRVFAAAGQTGRAQSLASSLASELQAEPQAYAKLMEGEIALARRDPRSAIAAFTAASNLVNTWIGHFDLGRAYAEAGAFTEADSEFDQCTKRRGEALSLFLDESPTYGFFPPVYYYIGRVREGLKSPGAAESYRSYLSIRSKAGEDPSLPEVRKRAGL
jgi:tetratricopeptide (TPR) repeat protein